MASHTIVVVIPMLSRQTTIMVFHKYGSTLRRSPKIIHIPSFTTSDLLRYSLSELRLVYTVEIPVLLVWFRNRSARLTSVFFEKCSECDDVNLLVRSRRALNNFLVLDDSINIG